MGSSNGFYHPNRQQLHRSNLPPNAGSNGKDQARLKHSTIAAIDESYSTRHRNLTYLTVVCSIPNGSNRSTFPKAETALRDPAAHSLVIANMMFPWQTGYERASFWVRGVWYGLAFANEELRRQGQPPVGVAFIDGDEPGKFKSFEGADRHIDVKFEPKHGTRHYELDADPFGVKLLTLADSIVGLVRQKVDSKGNLENTIRQLAEEHKLYITLAPALLAHNGTGLVRMQGQ